MGKLEEVLDLINTGVTQEMEIAKRLGLAKEEVSDIIKILENLGYVEKVEAGSKTCESCPLKKVCYGSCLKPTGVVAYRIRENVQEKG